MLRKLAIAIVGLLCLSSAAAIKAGEGQDLEVDAPLRVGVKHRPDACERKSQKGDQVQRWWMWGGGG